MAQEESLRITQDGVRHFDRLLVRLRNHLRVSSTWADEKDANDIFDDIVAWRRTKFAEIPIQWK